MASKRVNVWGRPVPMDLLLVKDDVAKDAKASTISAPQQLQRTQREVHRLRHRDQWLAAGAAGLHLASFAVNLAVNGFEWLPPDRYYGPNPAIRLNNGIDAGRFAGVESHVRWKYLTLVEGAD